MTALIFFDKVIKRLSNKTSKFFSRIVTSYRFKANGATVEKGFMCLGVPVVDVAVGGKFKVGENFKINNGSRYNRIGRQQQCYFIVSKNAVLEIGNNVGMSSTAIVCHNSIRIGNNVKIGGNCVIYDTDFHSLNFIDRRDAVNDIMNKVSKPVIIEDDVFIGAHVTILKGVTIGCKSIIGAGAVVTRSIPPNEIWAGNPAKKIRIIE